MKVKRSKKDYWMPAAPPRVDGADPKARLAHVKLLWSTTTWSTAVMEHTCLEHPTKERCCLEHHHCEHSNHGVLPPGASH